MVRETDEVMPNNWHVDRTVNLAVIVALAGIMFTGMGAVGTGVWFASSASTRIDQLEHRADAAAPQAERIIRLEAKLDSIQTSLQEIKGYVRPPPADHH